MSGFLRALEPFTGDIANSSRLPLNRRQMLRTVGKTSPTVRNIRRRFNGSRPESARSPVKGSSARSNLLTSASSKVIATFLASASAMATRDDSDSSLMVMRSPVNFMLVHSSISDSITSRDIEPVFYLIFQFLRKRLSCSVADAPMKTISAVVEQRGNASALHA